MNVHIRTPNGEMPAILVAPSGTGPWPGVVVIHDAMGCTPGLRVQIDWLASAGFLALAPDLFYRDGRWRRLFRSILDPSHPVPDLDIARAWRDWVGLSCARVRVLFSVQAGERLFSRWASHFYFEGVPWRISSTF